MNPVGRRPGAIVTITGDYRLWGRFSTAETLVACVLPITIYSLSIYLKPGS